MNLEYKINNNTLLLDHRKAAYWIEEKSLLISDLHLGKTNHFRKSGIAIPETKDNYLRLKELIDIYQPEKIYFLGDLFHSTKNKALNDFSEFFSNYDIDKKLILGNHDIIKSDVYEDLKLDCFEELEIRGLNLLHDPDEAKQSKYSICGHVHPKVRLRGAGKQFLSLPCFYFGLEIGILPAFGDFTGGYKISPKKEDDVFVIADNEVIKA